MIVKLGVVYKNTLTGNHAEVVTLAKDAQNSAFNDVVVYRWLDNARRTYVLDADEFLRRFKELKVVP